MQALGAGSMGMGSELMEAPEDEETFDVLNDETFGDMGDGKGHLINLQTLQISDTTETYIDRQEYMMSMLRTKEVFPSVFEVHVCE